MIKKVGLLGCCLVFAGCADMKLDGVNYDGKETGVIAPYGKLGNFQVEVQSVNGQKRNIITEFNMIVPEGKYKVTWDCYPTPAVKHPDYLGEKMVLVKANKCYAPVFNGFSAINYQYGKLVHRTMHTDGTFTYSEEPMVFHFKDLAATCKSVNIIEVPCDKI